MLLDGRGHLKLADFGTCVRMDEVSGFGAVGGVVMVLLVLVVLWWYC
jgi:hypothetical protein